MNRQAGPLSPCAQLFARLLTFMIPHGSGSRLRVDAELHGTPATPQGVRDVQPCQPDHFSLTVEEYVGDLQVLSFTGTEGISQPYRFDLELVSENPDLDLETLLHKQAFLAMDDKGSGIHGQIYRIAKAMPANA